MLEAETISWFSNANQTNLDHDDLVMDAGFHFELGVFSASFEPTNRNIAKWSTYWTPADSTVYNAATKRFADQFQVTNNNSPFLVGTKAWIYGFRVTPTGTDMLLFRSTAWTWPAPNLMNPFALEWKISAVNEVVLGSVNTGGSPFLMKSAAVQFFGQWQTEFLTGEPLNGPADDPDEDGTSNLLEFVFGSPPEVAGLPPAVTLTLSAGYSQISIPRRIDRPADLTVEVSGNLTDWQSGPAVTETVVDGAEAWIVRDLTPVGPAHPTRFMRLKVVTPAP